jgi:membrane-associated protease RseP (regulator of RpoE activity)
MSAFLLLWLCALANVLAFFGLRLLAARGVGKSALALAIGREHEPWASTPLARRVVFAVVGPIGCYLCAALFFALGASLEGALVIDEQSTRITVVAEGPAARAGIEDGDVIRAVNDVPMRSFADLRGEVSRHPNTPTRVALDRAGSGRVLFVTPSGEGKIGVAPFAEVRREPLGAAIVPSLAMPARVWVAVIKSFVSRPGSTVELTGPVGIVRETEKARRAAWGWRFVASLNAYFLFGPILLAAALFPRPGKRRSEPPAKTRDA